MKKMKHYCIVLSEGKSVNVTKREAECLSYLTRGYSSKMIAKALGISYRTVEVYCNNLRRKTNSRNRIEMNYKVNNLSFISSLFS